MTTTLSQTGLSRRLAKSTIWIRRQGERVVAKNGNGETETWARDRYSTGRLAGYRLISTEALPLPDPAE